MIEELIKTLKKTHKENFTKEEVISFLELKEKEFNEEEIKIDGLVLNPSNHEVIIDNKKHYFPKKEFKLLHYLIKNPNKCITRHSILKNCWEDGVVVGDRTIDVHICKIKRKLKGKIHIQTQKGVGYKWKVQ
jgi:two-component system alkaline phosphatase synthesis response regulator PhoP